MKIQKVTSSVLMKHVLHLSLVLGLGCQLLAALPGASEIIIEPKGFLEKDHQALRSKWAEMHLLVDAEKRWAGKPWAAQAKSLCRAGIAAWLEAHASAERLGSLAGDARKLMEAGCDDPLACWVCHLCLYAEKGDWRAGLQALELAESKQEAAKVPAALSCWIADQKIDRLNLMRRVNAKNDVLQAARVVRALSDGSYGPEFEAVMLRDMMDWLADAEDQTEESFTQLSDAISQSAWPEWVKKSLQGSIEIKWAWAVRGGGWAFKVPTDAWKGFGEHIGKAQALLESAWTLRPDRPEAAAKMITVLMAQSAPVLKLREWFDRATAAQFDYIPAYQSLMGAYGQRWGGTSELVLEFGKACAATGRFDTEVPSQLVHACRRVAVEQANARAVFSHASVKSAVGEYAKGVLAQTGPDASSLRSQAGRAAIAAWFADDAALAAQALRASGDKLDKPNVELLQMLLHHEDGMRRSIAAASGVWGEELQKLEQHYRRGDQIAAKVCLKSLDESKLPHETAKAYLNEIRDCLELPEKLKLGGWQKLPVYPGLATCLSTGGQWRADGQGDLVLEGDESPVIDLAFPLLANSPVEMRGEVILDMPGEEKLSYGWAFGPTLLWVPERFTTPTTASGVRGLFSCEPRGTPMMLLTGKSMSKPFAKLNSAFKPVNTFAIQIEADSVSFAVNGTAMPPLKVSALQLEQRSGLVALTGRHLPFGGKVTIRKLEVRLAK